MDIMQLVAEALKLIFPAYCANAIPVIAGGGCPMDFGRAFLDGRPIFGSHKTFRGFFSGLIIGTAVGLLESAVFGYPVLLGVALSLGALFGDLAGAFIKRRLGLAPGELLPVVDQIDFVVGALLFSFLFFLPDLSWQLAATTLIITVPVHMATNFAAWRLGAKNTPW